MKRKKTSSKESKPLTLHAPDKEYTTTDITEVASANVRGYLKNMLGGARCPRMEGGKGTRRKAVLVTSGEMHGVKMGTDGVHKVEGDAVEGKMLREVQETKFDASRFMNTEALNVDEEEWDTIDLPHSSPVGLKQDPGVAEPRKVLEDTAVSHSKLETPSFSPRGLALDNDWKPSDSSIPLKVEEEGAASEANREGNQYRSHWQRRDPVYEEMRMEKERIAALRRSARMQGVFSKAATLLFLFMRIQWIWRESQHPKLLYRLLHCSPPLDAETNEESGAAPGGGKKRSFFFDACQAAAALMKEAQNPSIASPSLQPAWVTSEKDMVQNKTSEAIGVLLRALQRCFVLCLTEEAEASTNEEEGGRGEAEVLCHDLQVEPSSLCKRWSVPLKFGTLRALLEANMRAKGQCTAPIGLPHPLYFSALLLALCKLAGIDARIVVSKQENEASIPTSTEGSSPSSGVTNDAVFASSSENEVKKPHLEKISLFGSRGKGKGRPKRPRESEQTAKMQPLKTRPVSGFWVEVWCPIRQCYISVNPCAQCTTLWGSPYTFAMGRRGLTDVTARYTSKLSRSYLLYHRLGLCTRYRFLCRDSIALDDPREVSDLIMEAFSTDPRSKPTASPTESERSMPAAEELFSLQASREKRQLESLKYAEHMPASLSQVRGHPLFVIESDLRLTEGIYPKDKFHTVGTLKGHTVYKRSAVRLLRSRDGWLREKRLVSQGEEPYKIVAPPASRPFSPPSQFFGAWQTEVFSPSPLEKDGSLPVYGNHKWYPLLGNSPPPGIALMKEPKIINVARKMQLEFKFALSGFERVSVENRNGFWKPLFDGIVVCEKYKNPLLKAYHRWMEMMREKAAAKQKERALAWWSLMIQRRLAKKRLEELYLGEGP